MLATLMVWSFQIICNHIYSTKCNFEKFDGLEYDNINTI